jgi:diguanylate cyclase (GGDEF)-like protein
MKPFRLLVAILALAGSALMIPGQVLPFRNWGPDNGLASSQVWAIYQDSRGYLWIGCTGGLSRFNGRSFRTYNDSEGLVQTTARAVLEDAAGRLWVGTHRGPCLYNPTTDTFSLPQDLAGSARELVRLHDRLYCLLMEGDLYAQADGTRWRPVPLPPEARDAATMTAGADTLYIGTPNGHLVALQPENSGAVPRVSRIRPAINRLLIGSDGSLWLATDAGLYRQPAGGALEGPWPGTAGDRLLTLVQDPDGSLWAGSTNTLLHCPPHGGVQRYNSRNGLVGVPVWSSFRDREGSLWFGTNHGLSQLANRQVEIFDARAGLPGKSIISVTWDARRRRVWFGTTEGLYYYAGGSVEPFPVQPEFFRKYYVWAILPQTDGSLWLGTEGGGIVVVNEGQWRTITQADGLPGNDVVDLYRDREGDVWAALRRGLARIGPGGIRSFGRHDGLPAEYVRCMTEIPGQEGIYVGTIGGGLAHYEDGRFHQISPADDLKLNSIFDLCWMNDRLWIATNDGLYQWDGRNFRRLGLEAGLPNISCTVFQPAGRNLLWVGTDGGAALLDTQTGKVTRILTRAHGLPGDEFTTQNCTAVDDQGAFWFGLFGGAVRLPATITQPDPPTGVQPQAVLDRVELTLPGGQRQVLRGSREVRLPAGVRGLQFFYDVLWFRDPQNILVSPRLEGFDEAFPEPGRIFMKEYTNLPAGSYRLEVAYYEGRRSIGRADLASFWIPPPVWQNPIFLLLAAMGAGLLLYAAFHLRYRSIEKEKERLADMVRTATHELEKKNTLLARLATTDELTGLFNRRYFMRSLQHEIRRLARSRPGEGLSLLMLDLDHFKAVNDTHGHEVGDRVLQQVARILRVGLRATDLLARFGGEEFVVMLPLTQLDGARQVAEKLRRLLEANPVRLNDHEFPCTFSIGGAALASPIEYAGDLGEDLIRRADAMMYEAKTRGRNCTFTENELLGE